MATKNSRQPTGESPIRHFLNPNSIYPNNMMRSITDPCLRADRIPESLAMPGTSGISRPGQILPRLILPPFVDTPGIYSPCGVNQDGGALKFLKFQQGKALGRLNKVKAMKRIMETNLEDIESDNTSDGIKEIEIDVSPDSSTSAEPQCWTEALCAFKTRFFKWIVGKFRRDDAAVNVALRRKTQEPSAEDVKKYIMQNDHAIEQFLANVPLEIIEKIYFYKLEKSIENPKEDDVEGLKKLRHIGSAEDFKEMLKSLNYEPTEMELLWELALNLRHALQGEAFQIYKYNHKISNPKLAYFVLAMETWNELPAPLVWLTTSPEIYVQEIIRRKTCMKITCISNPLKLRIESPSVFKTNDRDMHNLIHTILIPFFRKDGNVKYIIEIRRSLPFEDTDADIVSRIMTWGSMSLHLCSLMNDRKLESQFNDFLLMTIKAIFEEIDSFNGVVQRILQFAQLLVDADRASLFNVDEKACELVASVFDLTLEGQISKDKNEIRIPLSRGIAGHVALTGQSVNISDAYSDERFNREIDMSTGYRTVSILCMPIKSKGRVTALVQMVNKRAAKTFSTQDEISFKKFSTFFGLALHHAKLYEQLTRKEQKYKVTLDVLSYHNTCRESEVQELRSLTPPVRYTCSLGDFYLDPFQLDPLQKCQAAITMFDDLFNMSKFESLSLTRFILTVKKNYRDVPYHNFHHGWSVAQTMYAILKADTPGHFSSMQRLALFVASLCHDLDHRGYTNSYMSATASPLAAMYTTSPLEHHHFNITVTILQQDGHNIFARFSSKEYKTILGLIRTCILATDLMAFFPNLQSLKELCNEENKTYDWKIVQHSELAMAISMTAADLSAAAKPWAIQNKTVKVIFAEFYDQGDKEKAAGKKPLAMMDRNKPEEQPSSQVGFLSEICLPCYDMLQKLLPNTKPLYEMAQNNLGVWKKKAEEVLILKEAQNWLDEVDPSGPSSDSHEPGSSSLQTTQNNAENNYLTAMINDLLLDDISLETDCSENVLPLDGNSGNDPESTLL